MWRYVFICLFVLSAIAGLLTIQFNKPVDPQGGILKKALRLAGVSQAEDRQRSNMRTVFNQVKNQHDLLTESMEDRQRILEEASHNVSFITDQIRQQSDQGNLDLLRLRELSEDMNNQTRVLIENGRSLIEYNKGVLAQRKLMMEDHLERDIKTGVVAEQFDNYANGVLDLKGKLLAQTAQSDQVLSNIASRMSEVNQLSDVGNKITELSQKIKENRNILESKIEQQGIKIEEMRIKMEDLTVRNKQKIEDNRQRLLDQKYSADQRMQDQMDKIRNQRGF